MARLRLFAALGCLGSATAQNSAVWPTQFGPAQGTGIGAVAGPEIYPLWEAEWFNTSASAWSEEFTLLLNVLSDADGNVLVVAKSIYGSYNHSLLSLDSLTAKLRWSASLYVGDIEQYQCGVLASVLDACGHAYASVACGPEPLSMNNYLFRIQLSDGSVDYKARYFGTGSYTSLLPSKDCSVLFTLFSSRDAPASIAALNASTSSAIVSFESPTDPFALHADSATLTLSNSGETLVIANDPSWPCAAAYDIRGLLGSARSSVAPSPPPQLWKTTGPAGQGFNNLVGRFIPPVILPDDSLVLAFDPPWNVPGAFFIVQRINGMSGAVLWNSSVQIGTVNATITGLAASSVQGVVYFHVQYQGERTTTTFYLNVTDGSRVSPGCTWASPFGDPSIQRGIAVDDYASGAPVVYSLLMGFTSPPPAQGGGGAWPFGASGNVTIATLIGTQANCTGGACCGSVKTAYITNNFGHGPLTPPFVQPVQQSTGPFSPLLWPSLLIGPKPGQLLVLVPGQGIVLLTIKEGG